MQSLWEIQKKQTNIFLFINFLLDIIPQDCYSLFQFMKNYCTFPDETKIELHSILDTNDTQTYICYYEENLPQILWVPNEFIVKE